MDLGALALQGDAFRRFMPRTTGATPLGGSRTSAENRHKGRKHSKARPRGQSCYGEAAPIASIGWRLADLTAFAQSEMLAHLQVANQLDPKELKRLLTQAGFEVYRTLKDRVLLAERVRDNLIMDSGVAAGLSHNAFVMLRAERRDFPHASEAEMFEHARALGKVPLSRGYSEDSVNVQVIHDPGDSTKVLDTWFEITLSRPTADEAELISELRFLLALKKNTAPEEA